MQEEGYVFVLACDMPSVSESLYARLAGESAVSEAEVIDRRGSRFMRFIIQKRRLAPAPAGAGGTSQDDAVLQQAHTDIVRELFSPGRRSVSQPEYTGRLRAILPRSRPVITVKIYLIRWIGERTGLVMRSVLCLCGRKAAQTGGEWSCLACLPNGKRPRTLLNRFQADEISLSVRMRSTPRCMLH